MTDFPVQDALEQQTAVLPEDAEADPELPEHGDDVDPAEAYEGDRLVPVDDDEWF